MKVEMCYILERKDTKGNWHLITTSDHVWQEIYSKFSTKEEQDKFFDNPVSYFNHPAGSITNKEWNMARVLCNLPGNKYRETIVKIIDMQNLSNYDFNPLSQHCLKDIHRYHRFLNFGTFEDIINGLKNLNEIDADYYIEILKKSADYFFAQNPLTEVNLEGKTIKLSSMISNHLHLELMDAKFEHSMSNIRIVMVYDH